MIPDNRLSTTVVPDAYLAPDTLWPPSALVDYELGGVAISDPSQGLRVQTWEGRYESGDVIFEAPSAAPAVVYSPGADVTWLSIAFDQNMRPVIAFLQAGVAKMRWYDAQAQDYTVTTFPAGTTKPCVCMDDKRPLQVTVGTNDVIVAYTRSGTLYFRAQRDRFGTEYQLATGLDQDEVIRVGMTTGNRLKFLMLRPA